MRLFSIRYDQILGIGLFIFTIMSPKSLQAQIVINEILASNQHGQLDEDGDASDWVEILNLHDVSINLIELSLSDDPNEPMKWRFPDTQLGSGQRILVWCSGKDRAGLSQEQIENINIPLDFKPRFSPGISNGLTYQGTSIPGPSLLIGRL